MVGGGVNTKFLMPSPSVYSYVNQSSILNTMLENPFGNNNVELSGPVGFLQEVLDSGII